jgi:ribosomal protein S6--L-glutamate ligase
VVGVPGGWSSEQLADAFNELTGYRLVVDLSRVRLDLSQGRAFYQDVDLTELDGMAVKKAGPNYSPKLLDRLDVLHYISQRGVRIFSQPRRIARVLDRLSCTIGLAAAGIPMPPTIITEDIGEAARAVEQFGRVVIKPLFSTKARGMRLVEPGEDLIDELHNYKDEGNDVFYIQKMLNLPGHDLGLAFLGGRYLATYARVKTTEAWNTTTASGGHYEQYEPSPELIEVADRAQKVFGLDFTGVDVAETDDGPVVFEVSAFGGFRGLSEGCGIDAAKSYARYILDEVSS